MSKLSRVIGAVVSCVYLVSTSALSCGYGLGDDWQLKLGDGREIVVVGKVESVIYRCAKTIPCETPGPSELGTGSVTLSVTEYLKGEGLDTLVLDFPTGLSGTPYFKKGSEHLFYPGEEEGIMNISPCNVFSKTESGFSAHSEAILEQIRKKYLTDDRK